MFHLSYRTSFRLYNFIFIAVSTHSHIPCIVGHILIGLYIIVHWVFVPSFIRICVLRLNDINWQYNIPWHKMHPTLHPTRYRWIIYCHRCLYTQSRKYKLRKCITEKPHYCKVLLLQQYWLKLVNMCNSEC